MVAGQSLVTFLNKFELNRNPGGEGGEVEGVRRECASTRTASGTSGEADGWVPHVRRERGGESEIREARRFAGAHAGDEGVWG